MQRANTMIAIKTYWSIHVEIDFKDVKNEKIDFVKQKNEILYLFVSEFWSRWSGSALDVFLCVFRVFDVAHVLVWGEVVVFAPGPRLTVVYSTVAVVGRAFAQICTKNNWLSLECHFKKI